MFIFISGSDSRLRLWDIESGSNTLVNFEIVRLQTSKAIQLATTQDPALVFVPCMTAVKVRIPFLAAILYEHTCNLDISTFCVTSLLIFWFFI